VAISFGGSKPPPYRAIDNNCQLSIVHCQLKKHRPFGGAFLMHNAECTMQNECVAVGDYLNHFA